MNKVYEYHLLKKSKAIAYLLGAILGGLGIHRFYLGDTFGGVMYLLLFAVTLVIPPFFMITMIYLLVDLFYTSALCDKVNQGIYAMLDKDTIIL